MKALVDTNIILDVLTKRGPFYFDCSKVWSLVNNGTLKGYISAISVNNLFYIVRKLKDQRTAESFVDQILEDFRIIPLTINILKQARTVPGKDFEDLIQYFSAIHEGCDVIVTRNKEDFPSVGIKIMNPVELLVMFNR